jgi:hypothetical protein
MYFKVNDESISNLSLRTDERRGQMDGYSILRYKEANILKSVDAMIMGSSHAYRGYDIRRFYPHKFFNFGSTAQSPDSTYYLLKEFVPKLKPKLVIINLFPVNLHSSGMESYFDLSKNKDFSPQHVSYGLSLKSIMALNLLNESILGKYLFKFNYKNTMRDNEEYINGGYVKTLKNRQSFDLDEYPKQNLSNLKRQLSYVKSTISYLKSENVNILLLTQPVTKELRNFLPYYSDSINEIEKIAKKEKINYLHFTEKDFGLSKNFHYLDYDHLNKDGVKIYNKKLKEIINNLYQI